MGWELLADAGGPGSLEETRSIGGLPVDALAPAVRLAHVLHWQGRFRDADPLFTAAIASAREIARAATDGSIDEQRATLMLAFSFQHLGKSRFDEGRVDEALVLFEQALALRRQIGAAADQIASSEQAIAATRAQLASPDPPPA
jgi:tetratricopeptide (TPR) repeat protein